jgi:CxxC motif-containing protein
MGLSESRRGLLAVVAVLSLLLEVSLAEEVIRIDRLSARLTYASEGEKVVRASASAEFPELNAVGIPEVSVGTGDGLLAQVACVNAKGDRVHPQQAFVRFVRVDRETEDSVHVMAKKPIEMRVDLKLIKEIRANREFWVGDAVYRVEVIVGDTRMENGGVTWVAMKELRFEGGGGQGLFAPVARGVFDFDVGVKKQLLPEFSSPLPAAVKLAPRVAVAAAVAAVVVPLPLVLVAWGHLGALPLSLPSSSSELASAVGFEACLLAHMAALVMFWLQWNIVQTWKVMALLMVPTLFFGHRALSAAATRHVRQSVLPAKDD